MKVILMDYIYLIIIAIITGISIFGACIFLCRYNWFLAVCCSNSLYTYFAFSSHTNTSHLDLEVPKDSLNPDGLIRVKAESPLSLALKWPVYRNWPGFDINCSYGVRISYSHIRIQMGRVPNIPRVDTRNQYCLWPVKFHT